MLFHEELFTRSQCSCCQQEISQMGVECLDCENINLLLCCDCMGMGAEIGQHKADHRYRFFDSGSLVLSLKGSSQAKREGGSLFAQKRDLEDIKWTAREEIRLLDAIEQYGFGNWHDISKHIETKTPIEAKVEYVNRYVVGALGELTWSTDIPNDVTRNICSANQQKPVDHTLPSDDGPLSPSLTQRLPPLEVSPEDMLQLGYMPQRDDYEKEYDNDAEKLISQLSFLPDDEEYDVGAKLALVDIYSSRLRERARRKRMIRDFQLVAKFFRASKMKISTNPLSEWNGNKDTIMPRGRIAIFERTITDALRPFVQFYNNREFTNFVRNLARELEQKTRQNELFKYRINGIRRPDECIEYERAKGGFGQIRGKRRLDTIQESSPQKWQQESSSRKICRPFTGSTAAVGRPPKFKIKLFSVAVTDDDDDEQFRKRRKRRRKPLCRPKSHTAAVLQRRLQLKKLHGIKRIGTCFISTGSGRAESNGTNGGSYSTSQRKLIPTKRKTKGFGRPIYC